MRNHKLVLLLLLPGGCFATDNRPASSLTAQERQAAYNVAVNQISRKLKAPLTASYTPIDGAIFSTGAKNSIDVRLDVNAQNSYGALLREAWQCRVWPQRPDGLYRVACFPLLTGAPKDAVRGLPATEQIAESTAIPVSKTSVVKTEGSLITVNVESSPSDAVVEVDGYPAGRTPANVKLAKGEYTLKVSKPGFLVWTQKITVEQGKDKSFGITLSPTPKSVGSIEQR